MSAMPAVFLPYQQELMSSAATYGVTVVEKSRRTGYSWSARAACTASTPLLTPTSPHVGSGHIFEGDAS